MTALQSEESQILLFEFRLLVGAAARIVIGHPQQRFVRVNAITKEPDKDHAWEIGGDMLEAMELADDALPCWNINRYSDGSVEYILYQSNDVLAEWCALTMRAAAAHPRF